MTPEEIEHVKALYAFGKSIRQIADIVGGDRRKIKELLGDDFGGDRTKLPLDKVQQICELHEAGWSNAKLSDQFGVSRQTISRVLRIHKLSATNRLRREAQGVLAKAGWPQRKIERLFSDISLDSLDSEGTL